MLKRFLSISLLGRLIIRTEYLLARAYCYVRGVHRPEILFDTNYYRSRYMDVAAYPVDSLFHYLRFGARELRLPHPWFDTAYYLKRYPDVQKSGLNPLLHFLRLGTTLPLQPHHEFDSEFYLRTYPDVTGNIPVIHFLLYGAAEGRLPNASFDAEAYLRANKDVELSGANPVWHFAHHGVSENRITRLLPTNRSTPEDYQPARPHARKVPQIEIDVIIPVYKGFEETKECLLSVERANCLVKKRIVVVNDCSPDPAISSFLRDLAREERILLFENESNIGFVQSVNRGLSSSLQNDVVLLNSDTLVFNDWLDRICSAAYGTDDIGTVTPFSNNATICSFPVFCADNTIPDDLDLSALDNDFAITNAGRSVDIPTAVGFCMYIRRQCLKDIGFFDAATFGMGYGEENDFSLRAIAAGWRNIHACDVFVYHAGSVSFGRESDRVARAQEALHRKHPAYPDMVRRYVSEDPAQAFRVAVTAFRIRSAVFEARLAITHALGGGVAQNIGDIVGMTHDHITWLTLQPAGPLLVLDCRRPGFVFTIAFDMGEGYATLLAVLKTCGVQKVHVHHIMGHDLLIPRLISELGVPFDFTVHDYFAICPFVNLTDAKGSYCQEPSTSGCDKCIESRAPHGELVDITSWRAHHAWLFSASRVIAPSVDVRERIHRYFPDASIIAAAHHQKVDNRVQVRPLARHESLKIAVLGTMAVHKGFNQLRECARLAASKGAKIEFVLIGGVEKGLLTRDIPFEQTGPYDQESLPLLLRRVGPHLIWFPVQWPETFSYTLSSCLAEGLPAVVPDLGAFSERVGGREWTWVVPWQTKPHEWLDFFIGIRDQNFLTGVSPCEVASRERASQTFYPDSYFSNSPETPKRLLRKRSSTPHVSAIVSAHATGQIQACGYIRVIQPLTHLALRDQLEVSLLSEHAHIPVDCDVLLVQRTAVSSVESAERLLESCHKRGIRLIYETDDDLFGIGPEHPEFHYYSLAVKGARLLAQEANSLVVSTEELAVKLAGMNSSIKVVPNLLDDSLWMPPIARIRSAGQTARFLYVGSPSHKPDLDFLSGACRKLKSRFGSKVEFDVIGVTGDPSPWYNRIEIPRHCALSYPRFVTWLRGLEQEWCWGIAPLLDTPFNRAKSGIKGLEYGALGLPSICSSVPAYSGTIENEMNGLLVENTEEKWFVAMERGVMDLSLQRRLRESATANVARYTITARLNELKDAWSQLLGETARIENRRDLN